MQHWFFFSFHLWVGLHLWMPLGSLITSVSESFKLKPCWSIHGDVNGYLLLPCVWARRPGPGRLSRVTRDRLQIQSGMAAGFNLRLRGSPPNKGGSVSSWEGGPRQCFSVWERENEHVSGWTFKERNVFLICLNCLVSLTFPRVLDHPPEDVGERSEERRIPEIFDETSHDSLSGAII